jgi:glucose/arabinose dehydrogenase
MDRNGGDVQVYAKGLRNAAFFTRHPETGRMWTVEMGRDHLGDDTPPDEINIVEEGRHYGWPFCYGRNVPDTEFAGDEAREFCREPNAVPSLIDMQAHSAPLGLAFLHDTSGWPGEYRNDLIVAYHGSWNRSAPTGYKLVRFKFGADGDYEGVEDFISGWLDDGAAHGRPVDVKVGPDGALYVSDDHAGVIYRINYAG